MKQKINSLVGVSIFFFFAIIKIQQGICQNIEHVFSKEPVCSLGIIDADNLTIFASSSNVIYRSIDRGKTWKEVFVFPIADKKINRVYCDPFDENIIFAATQDGLYESRDSGQCWKRIFRSGSDLADDCLSLLKTRKVFYLGTKEGLFVSYDQGEKWQKVLEQFSESFVSHLVQDCYDPDTMYLVCERGVFKITNAVTIGRIYASFGDEVAQEDFGDYDTEISDKLLSVKSLAVSFGKEKKLCIATSQGVYFSDYNGTKWQKMPVMGLLSLEVRDLLFTKDARLFAATQKGVFEFRDSFWQKVYNGSNYEYFNEIESINNDEIWLAGRGGIYKIYPNEQKQRKDILANRESAVDGQKIDTLFDNEPNILDVQKAAIDYAEVNMDKIKEWRLQARLKAFFPMVSVGYDKNVYGSSSGAFAIGPRDWNLSFSWNLADFIWSTDQTSIDSRSRLTVQLRQDILDQVTRLFYERRRLKMEIYLSPPLIEQEKISKELELQELTATLDVLTNGRFSSLLE